MANENVVNIGLVQMAMSDSREENLAKASDAIFELADKNAQIVCLPELFLSKYFCQTKDNSFFKQAQSIPGPDTEELALVAKKAGVALVASLYEKAGDKRFNTAVVFDADGAILGNYRKMHIPDDPEHGYDEAYYFEKGDLGFKVFDTKHARIAPMVCWDQWFPEGARMVAAQGAQILLYPTAIGWNKKVDSEPIQAAEHDAWQTVQRSHSIANNIFTAAVNRVGIEGDLEFWGTSFVSDPYGRVIAKASTDREENIIVSCDLGMIEEMRRAWPFIDSRRVKYEES